MTLAEAENARVAQQEMLCGRASDFENHSASQEVAEEWKQILADRSKKEKK